MFVSQKPDITYTVAPAENDIPVLKFKILFLSLERRHCLKALHFSVPGPDFSSGSYLCKKCIKESRKKSARLDKQG